MAESKRYCLGKVGVAQLEVEKDGGESKMDLEKIR